jgi:hypothetical protein
MGMQYFLYFYDMRTTEIDRYIHEVIVPQYAGFDAAHKEDHALTVISQAMKLLDGMQQWLDGQECADEQWNVTVIGQY